MKTTRGRDRAGTDCARILVVEDFGPGRTLAIRVLTAEGYDVVGAAGAVDALEWCRTEHFDLVVTETEVAGGSGAEVARGALAMNPQVAVLFVTGCPEFDPELDIAAERVGLLHVPVDIDELTGEVRRVLAGPPA